LLTKSIKKLYKEYFEKIFGNSKVKKGEPMRKKAFWALAAAGISILLALAIGSARAELKVGGEAPSFQLPTSQDQLVDYYRDYYGKHHLVITFFPAAFTPV